MSPQGKMSYTVYDLKKFILKTALKTYEDASSDAGWKGRVGVTIKGDMEKIQPILDEMENKINNNNPGSDLYFFIEKCEDNYWEFCIYPKNDFELFDLNLHVEENSEIVCSKFKSYSEDDSNSDSKSDGGESE